MGLTEIQKEMIRGIATNNMRKRSGTLMVENMKLLMQQLPYLVKTGLKK